MCDCIAQPHEGVMPKLQSSWEQLYRKEEVVITLDDSFNFQAQYEDKFANAPNAALNRI
jgi:hypothetical protein